MVGWFKSSVLGVCVCLSALSMHAQQSRYTAVRVDGTRFHGTKVEQWHDEKAQPRISGQKLFEEKKPDLRWLRDNALEIDAQPESFVEFYGGDRLPGPVVQAVAARENRWQGNDGYLIVRPTVALDWVGQPREQVRVSDHWLRRIVWHPRVKDDFQPQTVFYRDGRQRSYRSLRWNSQSVRLLTAEGTEEISFPEIAEIHFEQADPWQVYREQLAAMNSACDEQIVQLETSDGLRLTTNQSCWQARHWRDKDKPQHWFQLVQPAWSLDPLWIRFPTIRTWRFFQPHQVPLSRIEPTDVRVRHALASGWNWQLNRNVQQGKLRAGDRGFGWGFGVHAYCRLEFPLSPLARQFQTSVALDEIAGEGGCAAAIVKLRTDQERELFRTEPALVGSQEIQTTEPLDISSGGSLVLEVDPLFVERPANTDPLDIRDIVDWLEPMVELDSKQLRQRVRAQAIDFVHAWKGWEIEAAIADPIEIRRVWDEESVYDKSFRRLLSIRQPFLTLRKQIQITPQRQWLCLVVDRLGPHTEPSRIQVLVDGEPLHTFEVPTRDRFRGTWPTYVSLQQFQGREVVVQIRHLPSGQQGQLNWEAIQFAAHPPTLVTVFDEDAKFSSRLDAGEGTAEVIFEQQPFSGSACLKVAGKEKENVQLFPEGLPIREHPEIGEFRYLRFAWRKQGGEKICLQIGHNGKFGPEVDLEGKPARIRRKHASYRYEAGRGPDAYGAAKNINPRLKDEWEVQTVDLYGDFGEFDFTGLSFSSVEDGTVYFDHVYLSRDNRDFELISTERR